MAIDVQELLDSNPAPRKSDWMTAGEAPRRADSDTFWADPNAKADNTSLDSSQQEFIEVVRPINTDGIRSTIATVEGNVVAFDRITAGLAALEQEHPHDIACDVTTPAGMKQALAGRSAWRNPRLELERARKAAKAPVLEVGRAIDAFAANVESRLRIGEANYDQQIKAEEHRRDVEKEQARQAEEQRVSNIRASIDRVNQIAQRAFDRPSVQDIRGKIALVDQLMMDERYQEFIDEAKSTKARALQSLQDLLARTEFAEAQAAQIEKDRAELEALRAERAERQRQDEAAAAARQSAEQVERQRADAEAATRRADEDRAAQAARDEADSAAAAERDELDRVAREQAAEAERRAQVRRHMVAVIDRLIAIPTRPATRSAHWLKDAEREIAGTDINNSIWATEPDLKQRAEAARATALGEIKVLQAEVAQREADAEAERHARAQEDAAHTAGPALLVALIAAMELLDEITTNWPSDLPRYDSVKAQADAAIKLTEVQ